MDLRTPARPSVVLGPADRRPGPDPALRPRGLRARGDGRPGAAAPDRRDRLPAAAAHLGDRAPVTATARCRTSSRSRRRSAARTSAGSSTRGCSAPTGRRGPWRTASPDHPSPATAGDDPGHPVRPMQRYAGLEDEPIAMAGPWLEYVKPRRDRCMELQLEHRASPGRQSRLAAPSGRCGASRTAVSRRRVTRPCTVGWVKVLPDQSGEQRNVTGVRWCTSGGRRVRSRAERPSTTAGEAGARQVRGKDLDVSAERLNRSAGPPIGTRRLGQDGPVSTTATW